MFLRYWDYDGKSSLPEERIDIVGILDEDELVKFKNEAILIRAVKEKRKIQWDSSIYEENSVWDVKKLYLTKNFVLSCGPWVLQTNGSDLLNLRIV